MPDQRVERRSVASLANGIIPAPAATSATRTGVDDERTNAELARKMAEIREEVVMSTLTVAIVAGIVLYVGNMLRNLSLGTPLSFLHTGLFIVLAGMFALRHRIGARVLAWLTVALLYLGAAGGILMHGLASNASILLMAFCFIAATFFGPRGALASIAASVCTIALAGVLIVSGTVTLPGEIHRFLGNPFSWVAAVLSFAAMASLMVIQVDRSHRRHVKLLQEQLHLAAHDPLTTLTNRIGLDAIVGRALSDARRQHQMVAVLLIDLDRFKTINDSLGHDVGDALLIEVARRLRDSLRDSDTIARLGGDEFVVVLERLDNHEITPVLQKLIASIGATYRLPSGQLHTSPSIGVSFFPHDAEDFPTLLRYADTAMYAAKAHGGNQFSYFAPAMNEAARVRLQTETRLREAIASDELCLAYQPKVAMNGRLSGFEALLRWQLPDGSVQSPGVFIPVAEESDLIADVGGWVLDHVCRQIRHWRDAGLDPPRIAINLSPRELRQPDLAARIARTLESWSVSPHELEFEVTEGAAMEDAMHAGHVLAQLDRMGFALSIDDFGTGFSSLSRLRSLPVDTLKIDRSFVHSIEGNQDDLTIARGTIALAHSLGMRVIAEGVETPGQFALLRKLGCDEVQGYLIARPAGAAEAAALMGTRQLPVPAA